MTIRPTRRALLAAPALLACSAAAQPRFPERPIRLVVPFPPGGTTDVLARAIAARWAEPPLSAQTVVENRAGGAGVIGTEAVARAAPDGHTLVLGNNQTHATNAALIPNLPYDPLAFAAVTMVARVPQALVVPAASPARDMAGLIALARAGRRLSYASSSVGSTAHIMAETFNRRAGLDAVHVPYRGAAPAVADLVAGLVDFMMATWASVSALVAEGRLRAIGVAGPARFPDLPEVPTLSEQGFDYLAADPWFGLFAPGGTPGPILSALHAATVRALEDGEVASRLTRAGFRLETMAPPAFQAFLAAEVPLWARLIREAGITAAG
ncbi:MAG: tripartite tricarboxylate transporter substrate-binding protein [Acetobacteraceae bacterium]|nr:tripartite tricarboxylate transporter substrate-binding protein [Acetobacteraceae bacterium]MDW8397866.1 tripartite tricarboxylate transporter substrate-binding protein [Acetobacteraceae bacterium]